MLSWLATMKIINNFSIVVAHFVAAILFTDETNIYLDIHSVT